MKQFNYKLLMSMAILGAAGMALMAQSGSISGSVRDDSGNIVAGASVGAIVRKYERAQEKSTSVTDMLPVRAVKITGSKGEFQIDGLQPGTYFVCAEKRGSGLLDPCVWTDKPAEITVKADMMTQGLTVQMMRGSAIQVQVADPKAYVAADPSKDDVRVGIARTGWPFIPALITGRDAAGKTLTLDVPSGQAFNLVVLSSNFTISDDKDQALTGERPSIPVQAQTKTTEDSAGKSTPTVTIKIAARAGGKQ